MPLNFGKKKSTTKADDAPAKKAAGAEAEPDEKPKKKPGFMFKGKSAREEMERAEKRQKERREQAGQTRRFWIKQGNDDEFRITFLDGELDDDGMLDLDGRSFYEHTIPWENRFADIRCTKSNEPCPICEAGDEPSFCAVFTVIEHLDEPWEDADGKKHHYNRRLLVVKMDTIRLLQKKATKGHEKFGTNGLAGYTFDVSRTGKRAARVGDQYDYVEHNSIEEIAAALEKPEHAQPADYENEPELKYLTAEELVAAGYGGKPSPSVGRKRKAKNSDMGDEL